MGLVGRKSSILRNVLGVLGIVGNNRESTEPAAKVTDSAMFDEYIDSMPCAQNAVDLVTGWNHALPSSVGAIAGPTILYSDVRIEWCIEQFGDVAGRRILELGPLEGSHTYMLHQHAPALIDAIEANKLAFMRCLIAKELLDLSRAHFMLGDFQKWLEFSGQRYDLIIASGVLYHMKDPVRLLELASECSDAVYLWTHYFSDLAMPLGDPRRGAFTEEIDIRAFRGLEVRLHRRSYHGRWRDKTFCGGTHDDHSWMEKEQILELLGLLGFEDVRVTHDNIEGPNEPSLSIFARRKGTIV